MEGEQIINVSNEHQRIMLNEFRVRKVFSLFPFIVVDGFKSDFHWTGK